MNNQYLFFFREIKKAAISFGWANEQSFVGLTDNEIEDLEAEKGIRFGENWRLYLKMFGRRIDVQTMRLYYGIDNMKRAEQVQYEENLDLEEGEEKIDWKEDISQAIEESFLDQGNNLILVNTLLEGGAVQYTRADDTSLMICNYDIDQKKLGICTPFKSIFRDALFSNLFYRDEISKDLRNKIPWLRYHITIKDKFPGWHIPRSEYYIIAHKRELDEKRIMGIDEFEIEFIKYLIEKKGFKRMPEIFDPYASVITFEEYLAAP